MSWFKCEFAVRWLEGAAGRSVVLSVSVFRVSKEASADPIDVQMAVSSSQHWPEWDVLSTRRSIRALETAVSPSDRLRPEEILQELSRAGSFDNWSASSDDWNPRGGRAGKGTKPTRCREVFFNWQERTRQPSAWFPISLAFTRNTLPLGKWRLDSWPKEVSQPPGCFPNRFINSPFCATASEVTPASCGRG